MANDTYAVQGSHPEPAFIEKPVRGSSADATSTPVELSPAIDGRLLKFEGIQIGLNADAVVTIREKGAGSTVLVQQQMLKGSTPVVPFLTVTPGAGVEMITSVATNVQATGIVRAN